VNRVPSAEKSTDRETAHPLRSAEPDSPFLVGPEIEPTAVYRFLRSLIRLWLKVFRRPIRVLGAEDGLPASGPVILMSGHPPSILACLIFIAAFDRPLRCFLGRQYIARAWAGLVGRALGVIADHGDAASLEAACRVGERGEALLAFAELEKSSLEGVRPLGGRAVHLAVELDKRLGGASQLAVIPVHIFLPQPPLDSSEVLIQLEPPVRPVGEGVKPTPAVGSEAMELLAALEPAFRRNVFRLRPADMRDFLADIEDALRQDLESKPTRPPERRTKLDGFVLSEFLVEWAEQENQMNPACLVALRSELDAWRERQRAASLLDIEAETSGPWIRSAWRRSAAWAETVAGLPVAVIGLVNSVVALAVLKVSGLGRIKKPGENSRRWLARVGIVLPILVLQVVVCDWRWGRSWAGVYAVSLPVSALYLWRYAWLLMHRSRLLGWRSFNPRVRARLEQKRRKWLRELDLVRDAYTERLGVAH